MKISRILLVGMFSLFAMKMAMGGNAANIACKVDYKSILGRELAPYCLMEQINNKTEKNDEKNTAKKIQSPAGVPLNNKATLYPKLNLNGPPTPDYLSYNPREVNAETLLSTLAPSYQAGLGLDYSFAKNLGVRAEYDFMNNDTINCQGANNSASKSSANPCNQSLNSALKVQQGMALVGLTWHF